MAGNAIDMLKVENSGKETNSKTNAEDGTEIQTYLQSFNKDLQQGVPAVVGSVVPPEGGYYVDQSGRYFFANADGTSQMVTVVQNVDPQGDALDSTDTTTDGFIQINEASKEGESQQMLDLNSGEYQTVTIVPSENTSGQVSYVLIVQQNEDEEGGEAEEQEEGEVIKIERSDKIVKTIKLDREDEEEEDQDLTVYDFEENDPIDSVTPKEEPDEMKFKDITKLTTVKKQTVAPTHMCNYCNYTTAKRYLLSRHMKSHSEERPHKCNVCERGFKTVASLTNHINTHTGTKPHKCKYCESCFTTSGELVRHVRYKHTHEKPHKCPTCDYASVELSKMRNHMRSHTGERPYQCPNCTYASPDTFKLKRHLRIHTGEKPYACDICHARFTQSNSLKAHRLIHTGEKPIFQCSFCPATCGRKTDLRIHIQKLHTAETPLKCKRCGKTFPDRYSYKLHCKSHEGEKCWKCDLCPYASSSQRHLESHMLIHTDLKPFLCEQCDQSFRQKQLLKRHVNLYHNADYVPPMPKEKTHKCPECKKAFRHKGNLLRHMTLHDPDSEIQEQQFALKIGRQKKVHIIDGTKVEVVPEDEDDYADESDSLYSGNMNVQGDDGQEYVVLEVIQVQGADGTEQNVAVVPEYSFVDVQGNIIKREVHDEVDQEANVGIEEDGEPDEIMNEDDLDEDDEEIVDEKTVILTDNIEDEKDIFEDIKEEQDRESPSMENCFGFDEEEEEEEMSEPKLSSSAQLISSVE